MKPSLTLLTALLLALPAADAPAKQPNIIVTDDQGYSELSCHGNPLLRTPLSPRIIPSSLRRNDLRVS